MYMFDVYLTDTAKCTIRLTALFSTYIHLIFVQKRPIGFGTKNNLGSLFILFVSASLYLSVQLDCKQSSTKFIFIFSFTYSFLHCMFLALALIYISHKIGKIFVNMFLLTYIWNFVMLSCGTS